MVDKTNQKQEGIDEFIDQNLKQVFSELESDAMPDQIVDLLNVLRAQDQELKPKE